MSRAELREGLLAFLKTIQRPGRRVEAVADDRNLVHAGLIDSLAMLEIVQHLERAHGVRLAEQGVDPDEIATISGILGVIERARG